LPNGGTIASMELLNRTIQHTSAMFDTGTFC